MTLSKLKPGHIKFKTNPYTAKSENLSEKFIPKIVNCVNHQIISQITPSEVFDRVQSMPANLILILYNPLSIKGTQNEKHKYVKQN